MKPTPYIDEPFAVALGFGSTEAQFTYAAADMVLALKWNHEGEKPCYEFLIIDTGFNEGLSTDHNPSAKSHATGFLTIAQAAALMFLCVAADELNTAELQGEVTPDKSKWNDTTMSFYEIVEKWLDEAHIPSNLRPIP